MIAAIDVYHGIFTNAFGRRGEGFRSFFLAPEWPAADRERADRWLRSLRLPTSAAGAGAGAASSCFRLGGVLHACLATVDPGFARDEHGRAGGFLVHALLTPLAEDRPAPDFGRAMLGLLRGFARPQVADLERLESYIEACKAHHRSDLPGTDFAALLAQDDEVLLRLFHLSAAGPGIAEMGWPEERVADLPELLATAAGLLPPRLRLGLRWICGLSPIGGEAFRACLVPAGTLRPAPRQGEPWNYLGWLRRQPADGGRISAVTASWSIRSWQDLARETAA